MRLIAFITWFAVAALQAPLQCAREPDPALERSETPAQALYGLAARFKAKGDTRAWQTTLEYLLDRYPSSRYAAMAKEDLRRAGRE